MRFENYFVVNTTERFIKIENSTIEYLDYKNFLGHNGYRDMRKMKTKGELAEFRFVKTDEETIYWKIPTGSPGIGFWNVTKKCALIGRKYEVIK